MNAQLRDARTVFEGMDRLIITFGTAWVYQSLDAKQVVSNCHKLPANSFKRYRLDVDTIVKEFEVVFREIRQLCHHLEILLSVSPIRHRKDGAHENTISKSTLHLAVNELVSQFNYVHYFPAYEILLDELRDYRFFARDMVHPADVAIDYIWQRFSEIYFTEHTQELITQIQQLRRNMAHRPIHPESEEYQTFLAKADVRRDELIKQHPFLTERLDGNVN